MAMGKRARELIENFKQVLSRFAFHAMKFFNKAKFSRALNRSNGPTLADLPPKF